MKSTRPPRVIDVVAASAPPTLSTGPYKMLEIEILGPVAKVGIRTPGGLLVADVTVSRGELTAELSRLLSVDLP